MEVVKSRERGNYDVTAIPMPWRESTRSEYMENENDML